MEFTNQSLKFHSEAIAENALLLTRLTGEEELSGLFRFELELVSTDPKLDLEAILYQPAKVGVQVRLAGGLKTFRWFAGCLCELQELEQGQGWTSYRAVLVPDLWKLTEFHRSRIFMDVTVDALVSQVLEDSLGLQPGVDFELKLDRASDGDPKERDVYPQREYLVQFEESDYALTARWLEHEGIFFFFENDGTTEKVVFADSTSHYKPVVPGASTYRYRPQGRSQTTASDGDDVQPEEVLAFGCRMSRQPKQVALNDYNWRDPSLELGTVQPVADQGVGRQVEYNDHYKTRAQGAKLAEVRAEEWSGRAAIFSGRSTCRAFRPGRTFELDEHFRDDFNQPYLLTRVRHEAEQAINLEASTVTGANYENSFEAIPADRAFRPERRTPWPAIRGVIHARVETEDEDDPYAHIDEHGRYRLRFPFDERARGDAAHAAGKASRWVRMAQPYAGPEAGFHFPLRPGTEVLVAHIDGDPDRPVITGAVPNAETPSVTHEQNRTLNRIRSAGGSGMTIDDNADNPGIVFQDTTGSFVSDRRFRHGSSGGDGGGPGGGGGGVRAEPRSAGGAPPAPEPVVVGRVRGDDLPGPGRGGSPQGEQGKGKGKGKGKGEGEDDGGDPDPITQSAPDLSLAFETFTGGEALEALGDQGRYVTLGAPLTLNGGAPDDGAVRGALDTLLGQHKSGVSSASALLSEGLNFDGAAFGSRLRILAGDDHLLQFGDKYVFADVSNDISFGTGGYGFHQEDGDTENESIQNGDSTSTTTLNGSSVSKAVCTGTSESESIQLGAAQSMSIGLDTSQSLSIAGAATQSMSINLAATQSTSLNLGASQDFSLTMGMSSSMSVEMTVASSLSLSMSTKTSLSLVLGAEDSISLGVGAKNEISIAVAGSNAISVSAAVTTSISISAAAAVSIGISAGATAELEISASALAKISISAAASAEIAISAAASAKIEISAAASIDLTIAAAATIEIDLSPDPIEIKLPKKTEITLQDQVLALQKSQAQLAHSAMALMTKLGA